MVGTEKFREIMGHFATGVTIVTARSRNGEAVGLTVNAFTSVSLEPLLVLVCVHREASTHDPLLEAGYFMVNVLDRTQEEMATRFSEPEVQDRFRGLETMDGPMGSPILLGSMAWLECRVKEVVPGGDHSIILGEVLEGEALGGEPLIFLRGRFLDPRSSGKGEE
jgi:flavin reductase (DIM6/NTAB) family NADH-FMN oxidoreductase RutF